MLPLLLICSFTRNNFFINIAQLQDIYGQEYSPEYHLSIFDEIEQKIYYVDRKTKLPVIFIPNTTFKASLGRMPIDIAKTLKITKKKRRKRKVSTRGIKNTHIELLNKVSIFLQKWLQLRQITTCDAIVVFKSLPGAFKSPKTALSHLFQIRKELLNLVIKLNINIIHIFDKAFVAYNGCKGNKRRKRTATINKIALSKYVYTQKN
jgi:hypothetical protein